MENNNELPIGSKIELPFVTLEVCESVPKECGTDCDKCFFTHICEIYNNIDVVKGVVGDCLRITRSDKKDVYFKVIERK